MLLTVVASLCLAWRERMLRIEAEQFIEPCVADAYQKHRLAQKKTKEAAVYAQKAHEAQARYEELEEKHLKLQARLKEIEELHGNARSRATMQQTLEEVEALLEPIKDVIKDDRPLGGPPSPARWEELIRKERR